MKGKCLLGLGLLAVIGVCCLAGCSATQQKPVEGVTSDGKNVAVTVAENPTTGYTWTVAIDKTSVLKSVDDDYVADDTDTNETGSGGMHTFNFEGVAKGTAVITMVEKQNWEGGQSGQSQKVTVEVGDDGTITKAEKE